MSIDPVTFMDTGSPGYFNRYAYTWNDPINNIDPDGRLCLPCGLIPLFVGGGGAAAGGTATVGAGTIAVGAGVTTFGVLVVTDPLDGVFTNDNADTTPEGREIRDHGKKGSGQEYIEGQGHTGESVDEIFGEGSTEVDDGGHDNASGQEKTPTTVTAGPNGKDWARTNNDTGQITQVNDRNNDRQPIPEPKQ